MMHMPMQKKYKLDQKSTKYVLVAYTDDKKGYRLYHPVYITIIISRDVRILDEDGSDVITSDRATAVEFLEIEFSN